MFSAADQHANQNPSPSESPPCEEPSHTISRALFEYTVPVSCAMDTYVEFPVHGCPVELITHDEREHHTERITLESIGFHSATVRWAGPEPLTRSVRLRLCQFPRASWISGRIDWSRQIAPGQWLLGCVFEWSPEDDPSDDW